MTHEDAGHYSRKHAPGTEPDAALAQAVKNVAGEEGISCAEAFQIVEKHNVPPLEVGRTADLLEVSIIKCQLGLYGYGAKKRIVKPAKQVSHELETAIKSGLIDDRLPCSTAWRIARELGLPKLAVSSACEKLGQKIRPCQLGSF